MRNLLLSLSVLFLLVACADPAERVASYVESANRYLEEAGSENISLKESKALQKKASLEARNALQIDPKSVPARFVLAEISRLDNKFRALYDNLIIIAEIDPTFVPAQVGLGSLQLLAGNIAEAEAYAAAATALDPDDIDLRVLNARVLLHKKDVNAGIAALDAVLADEPAQFLAVALKSEVLAITDPEEVFATLDRALKAAEGREYKLLRTLQVSVLLANDRLQELEAAYIKLVDDYPGDLALQNQLADFYASQGRLDDAEAMHRRVIEKNPENVAARLRFVGFVYNQRSSEAAASLLRELIADEPGALELRRSLGELLLYTEQTDEAVEILQSLAAESPMSEDGRSARFQVGRVQINQGEVEEGRATIESLLEDDPDNSDGLLLRAIWRAGDGDFDDAIADARRVLQKDSRNRDAMLLLARSYAITNRAVLSKDAYRRLLEVDPTHPDAAVEMAAVEISEGDFSAAEATLRKQLEVDAANFQVGTGLNMLLQGSADLGGVATSLAASGQNAELGALQLARSFVSQSRFPEATEQYKSILARKPDYLPAITGLVELYFATDQRQNAIAQIEGAVASNPDNLAIQMLQARTYARIGRIDSAAAVYAGIVAELPAAIQAWASWSALYYDEPDKVLAVLDQALEVLPANSDLTIMKGALLEGQAQYEAAIALYDQGLSINPDLDEVANNLANLLLDHRKDKESMVRALELAQRFSASDKHYALDTLGWAHYRNGAFGDAEPFLERAAELADALVNDARQAYGDEVADDAQKAVAIVHYHLAMNYLARDNTGKAKEELVKAVAIPEAMYPGVDEAWATLAKLGG